MKFVSLGSLTAKQLLMYWIIGWGFGMVFRGFIGDSLITLGWICLIWAGIKWLKGRKKKTI